MQKLIRVARESRYKKQTLVEEFKERMNEVIRRNPIEAERYSRSIKHWYEHTTSLDRYWEKE